MSGELVGIYVSLDALLDTRIATVALVHGDTVANEVLSGYYHTRVDDKFPGVDVEAYKSRYATRDVETLFNSTITKLVSFLQIITRTLMQQALMRPYHDGVRIVVNTYPYQLDEEDTQSILDGLAAKMNAFTRVGIPFTLESIVKSEAELTPAYCKENFSAMLMYEYDHWFFTQQKAFIRTPIPEVTLYAPAIYHVRTPTDVEIEEAERKMCKPFEAVEKAAKGWIDLQLIEVEHFSIVKPL